MTTKGNVGTFYVNGQALASGNSLSPDNVIRTSCFIGKSNWAGDPASISALYDDFKIFNKSLSQSEVLKVLNSYY